MTEFDAAKALREEIAGLVDIRLVLRLRERDLESRFGQLETELTTVKKLRGFAEAELDRKREVLKKLDTPV